MGPGPIGPIWARDPFGPIGPFGPGTHLGPFGSIGPIWAHWLVGVKHLIASMNSVTLVGGIGINTWSRKVSRSWTFN